MTPNLLRDYRFVAAITLMWLTAPLCVAAVKPSPAPAPARAPTPAASAPATTNIAKATDTPRLTLLGPGDSVTIQVYGQPDMTTTVYVGNDGTVRVPLAGSVQVGGITAIEASERVEKALQDGGYFVHPQVTVTLNQSRSERVSVLGEVRNPGSYVIDPSTSIIDLVAAAGGLTENGADTGYVRRREADGHLASYTVDLKGQPGSHDSTPSQRLESGDELYIPTAQHVYVYGEVTNPNMYKIEPGMTVMEAIIRAGGITPRGSERRVDIKRMGKDGQYLISKARLNDLVQADDVIRVKESIF
jgi:polysaccharide export outer membrane protein